MREFLSHATMLVGEEANAIRESEYRRERHRSRRFLYEEILQIEVNGYGCCRKERMMKQGRIHGVVSRVLLGRGSNITDSLQR